MYWLSSLSHVGLAEWSLSQNKYENAINDIVNLYVTALTKLKAFNSVTGWSKFQIWFIRLRMEVIHATQHMLATLETIRCDDLDDYRILKMMNNCADGFRTLASRYDTASQSMLNVDTTMMMVMEDFKVSALILEHASKICVKSRSNAVVIDCQT
ncbi:hypothetical protein BCR42DRAFT_196882 [Absidia repens]|uniref:Integrator complex subunit 7 helical bundle domain-containing protein n=1 Tax=Absidia repens TaxID=90262 RepID=A0A1X2ISZ2_9FUNG|nr:hypothetical protein BCR42DRAFT_196882 [Absidia repens]